MSVNTSTPTNWNGSAETVDAGELEFNLEDLDTYRHRLFANFALTMLFNAYGLYMIRRHSPREMATYRWYLLNILVWAFALDICISLLVQPYPLFPIFGFCTLGIIARFSNNVFISGYGVFIFTVEMAANCCFSIILTLFHRLTAICPNSWFTRAYHSWWGIALMVTGVSSLYVYVNYFCVQLFSAIHARLSAIRSQYYSDYPGLRAILDSDTLCLMTTMDDENIQFALACVCGLLIFLLSAAFATIFTATFTLWQRRNWLSAGTFRVHRQFIFALILQILVPYGSIVFPMTGIVICLYFRLPHPKAVDDVLLIVCSSHSTLNVLVMVACTRPYRDAAKAHLLWPIRRLFPRLLAAKADSKNKPKLNATELAAFTITRGGGGGILQQQQKQQLNKRGTAAAGVVVPMTTRVSRFSPLSVLKIPLHSS